LRSGRFLSFLGDAADSAAHPFPAPVAAAFAVTGILFPFSLPAIPLRPEITAVPFHFRLFLSLPGLGTRHGDNDLPADKLFSVKRGYRLTRLGLIRHLQKREPSRFCPFVVHHNPKHGDFAELLKRFFQFLRRRFKSQIAHKNIH